MRVQPVLLDAAQFPVSGELRFTWARAPHTDRRGPATRLRVLREVGWEDCPERGIDPADLGAVKPETRC